MTNKEKYAEQILEIACKGYSIAVNENSGGVMACKSDHCDVCTFKDESSCNKQLIKWCDKKYIEKHKILESDRRFLAYLPNEYKWMARCEDGDLHVYRGKPKKLGTNDWIYPGTHLVVGNFFKVYFQMIKMEDTKPWLIEDLKKLEVEP